jgi:hypothetical protein
MQNSGRNSEERGADGRIIIKWVSEKYGVIMSSGFIWLMTRFSGRAF